MAGLDGVDGSSNSNAASEAARRSVAEAEQAQRVQQQETQQAQQSRSCGGGDANSIEGGKAANEAANQKWDDFRQQDASVKQPKLPPKAKPAASDATGDAAQKPGDAATSSAAMDALRAQGIEKLKQAFAAQAPSAPTDSAESEKAKETSAPSKLDKTLDKNPSIKTNQDLINHLYEKGGGSWEGAAREAKKAGVTMSELVRNRQGDARKTAESKRQGRPVHTTPATDAKTPPATTEKPATAPASEAKSDAAKTAASKPIDAKDKIPGGPDRSQFDQELRDPKVQERLKALTVAEVGAKNPQAQRALMETIFNRAQATGKSLMQTMNARYYEPMQHGGGAYARADSQVKSNRALSKQLDAALFDVRRGSDVSHMATDNASGSVARSAERSQVVTARIGGETFSRKEGFRGGVHHPDYRPWLRNHPRNPSASSMQEAA